MFGYKLVKKSELDDLEDRFNVLADHIIRNGGFVDEAGGFLSDGNNPKIKENWEKYHKIDDGIFRAFQCLR